MLCPAVDAAEGGIIYDERLNSPGQYSGSPVAANQHVYLISNRGAVSVVKAGHAFQLVHRHEMNEPVFVTPAFDVTPIYIRSETHLYAFRSDVAGL